LAYHPADCSYSGERSNTRSRNAALAPPPPPGVSCPASLRIEVWRISLPSRPVHGTPNAGRKVSFAIASGFTGGTWHCEPHATRRHGPRCARKPRVRGCVGSPETGYRGRAPNGQPFRWLPAAPSTLRCRADRDGIGGRRLRAIAVLDVSSKTENLSGSFSASGRATARPPS